MTSPVHSSHSVSPKPQTTGETPTNHEAAFHQWNDALSQKFTESHPAAESPNGGLLRNPLYRTTQQKPDDVFQPDGKLEARAGKHFQLSKHQFGLRSQYTSMTTSLPAATGVAKWSKGDNVFITDPQPHGRYLNGLGYDQSNEAKGIVSRRRASVMLYER